MITIKKRNIIIAILSFIIMFFSAASITSGSGSSVYAAGTVGKLNGTSYSSFDKLTSALKSDYKNKKVTIEMMGNWNAAGSDDFDRRLVIPEGCSATLKMHGFVFNRNRAFRNDSDSNGELICMSDRSSLTIIGGETDEEKKREHPLVATYSSTSSSRKADKSITTYGGTLTGGCDSWGSGGIQMHEYASLKLYDVTIAGCGTRGSGTWSGLGGGIYMADDYGKVTMNDSTITGCFADVDGGGIYANGEPETIELNNSKIDRNYAEENGGGIYTNNQTINISGLNGSEITDNEAGGYGGGVCLWYGDSSLSGFKIEGNKAKYGAGVHLDSTGLSLSDLTITGNSSSKSGGGIFVHKGKNTIAGCTIRNNYAGGDGGGVYVDSNSINEGFGVSGKTIIKDNKAKFAGNQFHISSRNPEETRVNFNLSKGSEVWVSYGNLGSFNKVMVTQGKVADTFKSPNCIQYLHPSNGGWHFAYNSNPSNRKIYYVRDGHDDTSPGGSGEPYDPPDDPVDVHPKDAAYNPEEIINDKAAAKAGRMNLEVLPGGEIPKLSQRGEYALIRGFTRHEETDSDKNDSAVAFYYSDAFFDEAVSPYDYNNHLATASLNMAYAGMYLRAQEEPDKNDPSGNYYYNRHAAARQFMADIGCPDQNIYVNESNEKKPQTDSIGVTIASKELAKLNGDKFVPTGYTLLPIVVRGGGYELEWASNATLDTAEQTKDDRGKESKGFSNAADQVEKEIDNYIKKYGLEDELKAGKIRFWIAGYSRAGATSNITAKRLVEKYASDPGTAGKNNKVFAYTCEAPMGGSDEAEKLSDKSKYYCIHNMINAADLVPHVAPQLMGFKRYGVDHYIPGSDAGQVKGEDQLAKKTGGKNGIKRGGAHGIGSATTYRDNDISLSKQTSGDTKKDMLKQLKLIDSGIVFDDYFHPMAIKFISIPPVNIYEEGLYNDNHAEMFIPDFLRFVQEGMDPDDISDATQAVPNRDMFAKDLQPALRETLALLMTMDSETSAGTIGRLSTIMSKFSGITGKIALAEVYSNIVTGWSKRSEAEKRSYYTRFWNIVKSTGALDFLSESEVSQMEKNWPALANLAFTLLNADWQYNPEKYDYSDAWAGGADGTNTYLGTFATFSGYILQSHYPEINLAWARAYDSYYSNETKEYEILYQTRAENAGYRRDWKSLEGPTAYGKKTTGGEEEPVKLSLTTVNKVSGDQKIILENENALGEAVYYDLKETTNNTTTRLATNQLYRGGIDLSLGNATSKKYEISAYDISYGVRTNRAVYDIEILNDKHMVTVLGGVIEEPDGEEESKEEISLDYYREGDKVTIAAKPYDNSFFKEWRIRIRKPLNDPIGDTVTEDFIGDDKFKPIISFTMPKVGDKYRDQYGNEKTYPEGYILEGYAQSAFRIEEIEVPPPEEPSINPVGGESLAETAVVKLHPCQGNSFVPTEKYPITWTYTYTDNETGETRIVPTTGPAYRNTDYTASITIPKDVANNIAFVPTENSEGRPWLKGFTYKNGQKVYYPNADVTRNDADGSATVKMHFTTGDEGDVRPETDIKVTIDTYDINLERPIGTSEEYHVKKEAGETQVILTAPQVASECFAGWNFGDSGIILAEGYEITDNRIKAIIPSHLSTTSLKITAEYVPVINEVKVAIDEPVSGKPMQISPREKTQEKDATVRVTVFNEYEIHPDYVDIQWSPLPLDKDGEKIAYYLTTYTATVSIKPKKDENRDDYIMARKVGETGEYTKMTATFLYSEDVKVTFNNDPVTVDKVGHSVSYTFPMTKYTLEDLERPDDIRGVEHGTGEEAIRKLLPNTLRMLMDEGRTFNWPVTWNLSKDEASDSRDAVTWTATAVFDEAESLEEIFNDPKGLLKDPPQVKIYVDEAGYAQSPKADLETGVYFYDQHTNLTTEEEGGEIYYAVGTGDNLEYVKYDGNPIEISRDDPRLVDETITIHEENTGGEGNTDDDKIRTEKTGRKVFVLNAYTKKDDKWDSAVVTYSYVFDNEFPLPNGYDLVYNTEEQTGVSSSDFYEITEVSAGAEIKEQSAVATDAGEYDATLKIKDGFKWITYDYAKTTDTEVDPDKTYYKKSGDKEEYVVVTPDELDPKEEEGKDPVNVDPAANGWYEKVKNLTTDDQTVTFKISPMDIAEVAQITADGNFKSLDDLKKALKISPKDDRELVEGRDYEVSYGAVKDGKVSVVVKGKGNYTGTIAAAYIIDDGTRGKKYTITLDLNGGELDGITGVITEECYENTMFTLPEPERTGHTFAYWKGSVYMAGQSYKVTEDHTFVAQWVKNSPKEPGRNSATGDDTDIIPWIILILAAMTGAAFIAFRRKNC